MRPDTKLFLHFIAVILLLVCCTAGAGCLKEGRLAVQDMIIKADQITASYVTLNVTSAIQNTGGVASEPLEVRLQAFNTESRLLETETVTTIPGIDWGGTKAVSQSITLPRSGSYRLIVTVFRNDRFKGQGEIQVSNLEQLVPDTQQSGLIIDDMDFIVKNVAGGLATIQTDVYVANGGKTPSGPIIVEVKATELNAGLTADKQQAALDNIDPEKMKVASVPVAVPDQYNYIVETLIWRDGTVVKRSQGIVRLRPEILISNDTKIVTSNIETSKFVASDNRMATSPYNVPVTKSPGFDTPAALGMLGAVGGYLIIMRRNT